MHPQNFTSVTPKPSGLNSQLLTQNMLAKQSPQNIKLIHEASSQILPFNPTLKYSQQRKDKLLNYIGLLFFNMFYICWQCGSLYACKILLDEDEIVISIIIFIIFVIGTGGFLVYTQYGMIHEFLISKIENGKGREQILKQIDQIQNGDVQMVLSLKGTIYYQEAKQEFQKNFTRLKLKSNDKGNNIQFDNIFDQYNLILFQFQIHLNFLNSQQLQSLSQKINQYKQEYKDEINNTTKLTFSYQFGGNKLSLPLYYKRQDFDTCKIKIVALLFTILGLMVPFVYFYRGVIKRESLFIAKNVHF